MIIKFKVKSLELKMGLVYRACDLRAAYVRARECNTILTRKHVVHRTLVNIAFHSCYASASAHSHGLPRKGVRMPISWSQVRAYLSGRSETNRCKWLARPYCTMTFMFNIPLIRDIRQTHHIIVVCDWYTIPVGACNSKQAIFSGPFFAFHVHCLYEWHCLLAFSPRASGTAQRGRRPSSGLLDHYESHYARCLDVALHKAAQSHLRVIW